MLYRVGTFYVRNQCDWSNNVSHNQKNGENSKGNFLFCEPMLETRVLSEMLVRLYLKRKLILCCIIPFSYSIKFGFEFPFVSATCVEIATFFFFLFWTHTVVKICRSLSTSCCKAHSRFLRIIKASPSACFKRCGCWCDW